MSTSGTAANGELQLRRRHLRLVATVLGVIASLPSAAPSKPYRIPDTGVIWLQGPTVMGDQGEIDWQWFEGTEITPRSRVRIQVKRVKNGRWATIARGVPIKRGSITWDATRVNRGKVRRRTLRLIVEDSGYRSTEWRVWVDHVPPTVRITRPAASHVEVADRRVSEHPIAVVHGTSRLEFQGEDFPWGISEVDWYISDGVLSSTSPRSEYDFGRRPGMHTVYAIAYDHAGNQAVSETIKVLGLPDPTG